MYVITIRYFLRPIVGNVLQQKKFLSTLSEYETTPLDVEISTFLTLLERNPFLKSSIKYKLIVHLLYNNLHFFFKQKTAYDITVWLEFIRVLFRSKILLYGYEAQAWNLLISIYASKSYNTNINTISQNNQPYIPTYNAYKSTFHN